MANTRKKQLQLLCPFINSFARKKQKQKGQLVWYFAFEKTSRMYPIFVDVLLTNYGRSKLKNIKSNSGVKLIDESLSLKTSTSRGKKKKSESICLAEGKV